MSTVGQWVGGVGGAIIGAFLGGPAGAVYGAQIGLTAGTLLDPPKGPDMRGPRLDDLTQQTSTYGAPIPRLYGTCGIAGNIIWLENNRLSEVATTEDVGGKGGGPTATQTTYSYYATFAVAICQGPIAGIRRIWLGPNLFYDASAQTIGSVMASDSNWSRMRFYLGTDDQLPDPRIEAQFGSGSTPAYRNIAYVVFEDLPLADYGNTLPKVTVEAVDDSSVSPLVLHDYTYTADQRVTSLNMLDENGLTYLVERQWFDDGNEGARVYLSTYAGGSLESPKALADERYTSSFDSTGGPYSVIPGQTYAITWAAGVRSGGSTAYIATSLGDFTHNIYAYRPVQITNADGPWMVVGMRLTDDKAYLYTIADQAFVAATVVSDAARLTMTDDGLVYAGTSTGIDIFRAYPDGLQLEESVVLDYSGMSSGGEKRQFYDGSKLWVCWIDDPDMYLRSFNVSDWSVADDFTFSGAGGSNLDVINFSVRNGVFSVMTGSFAEINTSEARVRIYALNVLTDAAVPLADIVEEECLRSGLISLADLDTSLLTDDVAGYRVAGGGSLRASIEPLSGAYLFDTVQAGYGLKFVPRGGSSIRTIPWQSLVPMSGTELEHDTEMDSQLPARVAVRHLDRSRDYDINEQYADRLGTDSVKKTEIDLPVVITPTEAAQLAEILVNMYWVERDTFRFALPPTQLDLEPSDVITIQAEHATFEMRLTEVEYMEDGVLGCRASATGAGTYTSSAEGINGEPGDSLVPLPGQTLFRLLDIPVILSAQNTAGVTLVMRGYTADWPGGVLTRSPGGTVWTPLASILNDCNFGSAQAPLPANPGTLLERGTSLNVSVSGALSSASEGDMLNGSNYAAYGAPGRWEILRFASATLEADGTYTLSVFKRGDRGTEWATGLHQAGDIFVYLDDPDTAFVPMAQDIIGASLLYRGVTIGQDIDTASDSPYAYQGVNLKPLSGVHPSHEMDGTTLNVSWQRRTRFGGEWRDFVDATLSEATESYEVDVTNNETGLIVRTITSSSSSISYTEAEQTADGVALITPLTLTNPGAETGDTTGWTNETGSLDVRTTNPAPHSGSYYFFGGANLTTTAYQDIDVTDYATEIDASAAELDVTWWQNSFSGADDGEMRVDFLDGASSLISSANAGLSAPTEWTERNWRPAIPANTRTIRLKIHCERDSGTNNDAYFDDISAAIGGTGVPDVTLEIYQMSDVVGRGYVLEYTPE